MTEYFTLARRVPNSPDALHCLQAALMMAVEILGGEPLSCGQAEEISGFRPGAETWPYRMLAWLAANGYEVTHIDPMDARALADDPRNELVRGGFDQSTIDYFFKISDFEAEARAISACVEHGVRFEVRVPEVEDITDGLTEGWLPIVALDASVLTEESRSGFQGHMVLVTGADPGVGSLRIQDSGPPTRWDWEVPETRALRAMRTPTETSGTVTLVRCVGKGESD